MKDLSQLNQHKLKFVFTDIDGTLTEQGRLKGPAYQAMWNLYEAGFKIIPVTGRPAGWCEMIARLWPVEAVIGENGGFYFQYKNQKMHRHYEQSEEERKQNRIKLDDIKVKILQTVPKAALASDQFCRLFDLAIDFCEDVPALPEKDVLQIKKIFEAHGAQAKISSIHVNGWFGAFDKASACLNFAKQELGLSKDELLKQACFLGDSPNDEPLFELFTYSFGVANVQDFAQQMQALPAYISKSKEGSGFKEIAERLISQSS